MTLAMAVLLTTGAAGALGAPQRDVTAAVRAFIEEAYRKNTGLGFKSFECGEPQGRPGVGGFLDCEAVDDEGDRLRYTLKVDAAGDAQMFLESQDGASVPARARESLEPPCQAFLKSYAAQDWKGAYAALHPALRRILTRDQLRERVEAVRKALGAVRSTELRAYALRRPDQHELEYAIVSERGRGTARFRIDVDDDGPKLSAFLVTPEPGSALHRTMIDEELRRMLSGLIGSPVERLDAPLERLAGLGDTVDGTIVVPGGRQMAIRIAQKGRADDFDIMDYAAHVTDAPFLVERFLAGRGQKAERVDCPAKVVPDGSSQKCQATLVGGKRLEVTLARMGERHRVIPE